MRLARETSRRAAVKAYRGERSGSRARITSTRSRSGDDAGWARGAALRQAPHARPQSWSRRRLPALERHALGCRAGGVAERVERIEVVGHRCLAARELAAERLDRGRPRMWETVAVDRGEQGAADRRAAPERLRQLAVDRAARVVGAGRRAGHRRLTARTRKGR